ncbi:hypothetical protein [Roseomonas sp. WA12]
MTRIRALVPLLLLAACAEPGAAPGAFPSAGQPASSAGNPAAKPSPLPPAEPLAAQAVSARLPDRLRDQTRLAALPEAGSGRIARYSASSGSTLDVYLIPAPGSPDGIAVPVLDREYGQAVRSLQVTLRGRGTVAAIAHIEAGRGRRAPFRCAIATLAAPPSMEAACLSTVSAQVARLRLTSFGSTDRDLYNYTTGIAADLFDALRGQSRPEPQGMPGPMPDPYTAGRKPAP